MKYDWDNDSLILLPQGKEVATNMVKLNPGTVVFEDINQELMKGQVLKPVERNPRHNQKDPLTGRIRYRGKDRSEVGETCSIYPSGSDLIEGEYFVHN